MSMTEKEERDALDRMARYAADIGQSSMYINAMETYSRKEFHRLRDLLVAHMAEQRRHLTDLFEGRCSRCSQVIEGFHYAPREMTAGFYLAEAWAKYANPGELIICDGCMWRDPRYVADYGDNLAPAEARP